MSQVKNIHGHPPLETLKELFVRGLKYSQDHTGFYYPPEKELGALQQRRVAIAKTYQEFASAVQIYNYSRDFGFPGPPDIEKGDILRYSNFQFGKSIGGIYKISGSDGTTGFAYTLSRNEIAPPVVVREMGLDPKKSVIWLFGGGYGSNDKWHSFPFEWLENTNYEELSPTTFYFDGSGPNRVQQVQLASSEPMRFDLDILYQSVSGNNRRIKATLVSMGPPMRGNRGNTNVSRAHNRITSYLYPSMSLELIVNNKAPRSGSGFIQHTEQVTPPSGFAAQTRLVASLKPKMSNHVLYLLLQFADYQYYIGVYITGPIQVGVTLNKPFSVIKYAFGVRTVISKPVIQILPNEVMTISGVVYPTEFMIYLGDDNIKIKSPFGGGITTNSWFQGDFEQPCIVVDSEFNDGVGLIQYNSTFGAKEWTDLALGTGNPGEAILMLNQPFISSGKRMLAHLLVSVSIVFIFVSITMLIIFAIILSFRTC
jgi:hypothetical protein